MRIHHTKQNIRTDDIVLEDKSVQLTEFYSVCDKCEEALCDVKVPDKVFIVYPCFYCGNNIESKEQLKDHKINCHEKLSQPAVKLEVSIPN